MGWMDGWAYREEKEEPSALGALSEGTLLSASWRRPSPR